MANPQGTPVWFELNTPDQVRARQFYSDVAGWTIAPSPMAEHGGYLIAETPGALGVAGITTPPEGAPAFGGWSIYFAVDDVDASAERITSLGGALKFGPMDIPGVGRFAVVSDPQGVVFFIMRGASPEESQAFKMADGGTAFGHGVWIELATPDPDDALAFYGALFGWEKAGVMPMGEMGDYAFIGHGDVRPGAIMSSATTGAPARWNWYVHVPDIDAAIATTTAGGGALIQGPDEIPGGDYAASITDPDGAQIGIVGPRTR